MGITATMLYHVSVMHIYCCCCCCCCYYYYYYYYYIRLTVFFQDNLGKPALER